MNPALSLRFVLLIVALTALLPAPPSAAQDAERNIRYYNSNWSFNDVDVGTLARRLDRIGLQLPVDLRGKVTVDFTVGIPWNALATAKAWRLDGTLTSDELVVNSLRLRNVQLATGAWKP